MNAFGSIFTDNDEITAAFKGYGALSWGDMTRGCSKARNGSSGPGTGPSCRRMDARPRRRRGQTESRRQVADVGCGHGASVVVMADAYPNSRFWGFDFHAPSIDIARARAEHAEVADRTTFEVAAAEGYDGRFDLICFFDCLHDMGDPAGSPVTPASTSSRAAPCCLSSLSRSTTRSNLTCNPMAPCSTRLVRSLHP